MDYDRWRDQWRRHRPNWSDCGAPDCGDLDCFPDCDCMPDCSLFLLPGLFAVTHPRSAPRTRTTGPARAGIVAIRGYQRWLSPHLGTRCRQIPSCSNYGLGAVRRYGLTEGSRLTAARIRRCNPSTPRGTLDPVP